MIQKCWDVPPEVDPMRVPWGWGAPCSPADSHHVALQLGVAQLCSQLGATLGSTGGPFSLSASESQKQLQPQHLWLSTLWSWASFLRRNDRNSIHFQITLWMSEGAECSPNVNSCGSTIDQQSLPPASLSAPCPLLARFHLFHSTWFFVSGGVRHF